MITWRFLGVRPLFISLKMRGQSLIQRHDSAYFLAMEVISLATSCLIQ
jgi:hypothetical protein